MREGLSNTDGSISWLTSEQTFYSSPLFDPVICLDSSGYPFIAFDWGLGGYIYVTKSKYNNGTWSDDTGYPFAAMGSSYLYANIIALTSNKVYVVGSGHNLALAGRLYNGSTWESTRTISTSPNYYHGASITSRGNDVIDVLFLAENRSLIYFNCTSSTSNPETLLASGLGFYASPTISKNATKIYATWIDSSNNVYMKMYLDNWGESILLLNAAEFNEETLNVIPDKSGEKFGLIYVSGSSGIYSIMFYQFTYSATASRYIVYNTNKDCGIFNIDYQYQTKKLTFDTSGNVTITGAEENPQGISVNGIFVSWSWNDPNITLNNVNGNVVVEWRTALFTSGEQPETSTPGIATTKFEFGTLGQTGLLLLMGTIMLVGVGAVISSVRKKKHNPTGYTGRRSR
jgi:hypothetical protein